MSAPKPPAGLSAEARGLWRSVVGDYQLEPHHRVLLRTALEALDRLRQAQGALRKDGPVFVDRFGQPRKSPWVGIEEAARIAFLRGMRELALDGSAPPDLRPPYIRDAYERTD